MIKVMMIKVATMIGEQEDYDYYAPVIFCFCIYVTTPSEAFRYT